MRYLPSGQVTLERHKGRVINLSSHYVWCKLLTCVGEGIVPVTDSGYRMAEGSSVPWVQMSTRRTADSVYRLAPTIPDVSSTTRGTLGTEQQSLSHRYSWFGILVMSDCIIS
jgi:hypothetical protein